MQQSLLLDGGVLQPPLLSSPHGSPSSTNCATSQDPHAASSTPMSPPSTVPVPSMLAQPPTFQAANSTPRSPPSTTPLESRSAGQPRLQHGGDLHTPNASLTQMPSHAVWQQNASVAHTASQHFTSLQPGSPVVKQSWS